MRLRTLKRILPDSSKDVREETENVPRKNLHTRAGIPIKEGERRNQDGGNTSPRPDLMSQGGRTGSVGPQSSSFFTVSGPSADGRIR